MADGIILLLILLIIVFISMNAPMKYKSFGEIGRTTILFVLIFPMSAASQQLTEEMAVKLASLPWVALTGSIPIKLPI